MADNYGAKMLNCVRSGDPASFACVIEFDDKY